MDIKDFKERAGELLEWIGKYYGEIENYPVQSKVLPREIFDKLPATAPDKPEDFKDIFKDFNEIIMAGITHWQHPRFMGYFPANTSYPSILGEMLTASLGVQCMSWITSPAATELEEVVMNWLKGMLGIPDDFYGVIQDSASSATLAAVLTAREKFSNFQVNLRHSIQDLGYRAYCSEQAHSSVEKAIKIAGIGSVNLRKIEVNDRFEMDTDILEKRIRNDLQNNNKPMIVVATIGTTGTTSVDPLKEIARICKKYNIWLHVDAALAGSAMVIPEMRKHFDGLESADSLVLNPHKWMFTNFDCSAFFIKDKQSLIKTFSVDAEYLKTNFDNSDVNNYRDWGVQLGRRFRALKLWFIIRSFGVEGIREKIKEHIQIANKIKDLFESNNNFELMAPVPFNCICFRLNPGDISEYEELNNLNKKFHENINSSGKLFLTHTVLNKKYVIRMVLGQTYLSEKHALEAFDVIIEEAEKLLNN